MGLKMNGFDDLSKKMNSLAKNAEKMSGDNEVSSKDLFPDSFMRKNTEFSSFSKLLEAVGVTDNDSFEKLPEEQLDKLVSQKTRFSSWENMKKEATGDYVTRQLGL